MSGEDEIRSYRLILLSIVLFLCVFVYVTVRAAPEDHPLCRAMASAQVSLSGRYAEWIDYAPEGSPEGTPEGWKDMPTDLYDIPIDILYTDERMTQGYLLMVSPSEMELWVFPHWSFEFTYDANGEHGGTHDLCPVLIYDLNPENR